MLAEVETLYETNPRSVSDMLREAAGNIETETEEFDTTKAMIAVQLTEGGKIQVYGWGKTNNLEAIAALNIALVKLANEQLEVK